MLMKKMVMKMMMMIVTGVMAVILLGAHIVDAFSHLTFTSF